MRKSFKSIIAVLLIAIWLAPMGIKLADSAFHKHDTFSCNAGPNERHIHSLHENCLIPFLSLFVCLKTSDAQVDANIFTPAKLLVALVENHIDQSYFSYSLRAPPVKIL